MNPEKVSIELSKKEAIVLFEFLAKFNKSKDSNIFDDQSEQRVLWNLESDLEKALSEPFKSNYSDIVKDARDSVRDK